MKKSFYFFLFATLTFSCNKDQQYVPNVYVNLTIYINDPQNITLTSVGGWKYFPGGNRGVIVYRKGQNEFMAYERTCPYKPEEATSIVEVDTTNNVLIKDVSCGSQFLLSDGSTISGVAVIPLRAFKTIFDGTTLRVSN